MNRREFARGMGALFAGAVLPRPNLHELPNPLDLEQEKLEELRRVVFNA